jgi:hypothetical protein
MSMEIREIHQEAFSKRRGMLYNQVLGFCGVIVSMKGFV